jgi:hypothetical protein
MGSGGVAPHVFNLVLSVGEWLASCVGRLTPSVRAHGTCWMCGWVGRSAHLHAFRKRHLLPQRGIELQFCGRQWCSLVAVLMNEFTLQGRNFSSCGLWYPWFSIDMLVCQLWYLVLCMYTRDKSATFRPKMCCGRGCNGIRDSARGSMQLLRIFSCTVVCSMWTVYVNIFMFSVRTNTLGCEQY